MKNGLYLTALWLLMGLCGELLLHSKPKIQGIAWGAVTLGKAISHLVTR